MPSDRNSNTASQNRSPRRVQFMLTLWVEGEYDTVTWRGSIEASDGRRQYFDTLTGLEQIMQAWNISMEK